MRPGWCCWPVDREEARRGVQEGDGACNVVGAIVSSTPVIGAAVCHCARHRLWGARGGVLSHSHTTRESQTTASTGRHGTRGGKGQVDEVRARENAWRRSQGPDKVERVDGDGGAPG